MTKAIMNMAPRYQKIALNAHVTFTVGWCGAVMPYLALAIAALTSHDEHRIRAAYLSMELIGWFVIVPFSFAALVSGLIQSLWTRWGLFRYWWIVAKLVLTVFAVAILFQHIRDVSRMAVMAKQTTLSVAALRPELIHSAGGLVVLLAAMILSVLKPWGLTPYGRRSASRDELASHPQAEPALEREPAIGIRRPHWRRIIAFHAIGLVVLFAIMHLTGLHHH